MKYKSVNINIGIQLFKSLSDESRIRILSLILTNECMCSSDLEVILDYTQAKTSRHLNFMRAAGFLSKKKHNQWTYYSVKDEFTAILNNVILLLEKDSILEEDQTAFNTMYSNNTLAIRKLHNSQKRYTLPSL